MQTNAKIECSRKYVIDEEVDIEQNVGSDIVAHSHTLCFRFFALTL